MIDRRPGSSAAIACRVGAVFGRSEAVAFPPLPISVIDALEAVEDLPRFRLVRRLTTREIIRAVAHSFAVPSIQIIGERRFRPYVHARQAVFLLAKELTSASFPVIGFAVGDRDHTTVMHGVRAASERVSADADYAAKVAAARALLIGGDA